LFFALFFAWTQPSLAQGFNAHGLHLAPQDTDGRGTLVVRQPLTFEQGEWRWGLIGEFGYGPLARARQDSPSDPVERTLVMEGLTTSNLSVAFAPRSDLLLDVHLPVHLLATGLDLVEGPTTVGDMRLATTWTGHAEATPPGTQIGSIAWIDLPTGAQDRYLGSSGIGGGFGGQAGWSNANLRLAGEVGMQFHPKMELGNLTGANALVTGFSVSGYVGQKMGLVGEIRASSPVKKSVVSGSVAHTEMIGSARWGRGTGRAMTAGFGSALSGGAGLPAWRAFLGGAFGRRTDATLTRAENPGSEPLCPDGSAPVLGRTLADGCYAPLTVVARYQERTMAADYIVRTQGGENRASSDANGWRTKGLPGDTWVVQATAQGCLSGSASITVSDLGGWIDVPLEPNRDATLTLHMEDVEGQPLSGAQIEWTGGHPDCFTHLNPSAVDGTLPVSLPEGQWGITIRKGGYAPVTRSVTVVGGEESVLRVQLQPVPLWMETERIVLYEPLAFAEQTATLAEESLAVVDALAELLKAQPEVRAIRIDAHTHDRGSDEDNLALSTLRANAVRDALIERGIEAERMKARGIGEAEPIAPNRTALGRSRNERVEIQVLETTGEQR